MLGTTAAIPERVEGRGCWAGTGGWSNTSGGRTRVQQLGITWLKPMNSPSPQTREPDTRGRFDPVPQAQPCCHPQAVCSIVRASV